MNQHIPDLQKALRHFARQIEFALKDLKLTPQTFWEQTGIVEDGNNAKDNMFNYLYTFSDTERPPYKQDYYEVLYEGNYLNLDENECKHLSGLIGRLGIDTSNGFEDWHNLYLEIVFGEKGEYQRYLSNPNTYFFDYQSILKKDAPSVFQDDNSNLKGNNKMEQSIETVFQQIFNDVNQIKFFNINVDNGNIIEYNGQLQNHLGRQNSKTIAKKWAIGLQGYFVGKSKSEILNRLDSDKSHWKNTQFKNIETFNRLIENPNTEKEVQKVEIEKENHMLFYHFFYRSIKSLEDFVLNNHTPSVKQNEIQNTEIESMRKARIHFANQLKTFLDVGCTYHDFWRSNLAKDIFLCYSKMWDLSEKHLINDFSGEKIKALFILYGIDERNEDLKKSIIFTGEMPAFQRIGIDCSNGFQEWHEKYCELAEREWNQYSSNIDNYSFNFSILGEETLKPKTKTNVEKENNTPSVSEPEKSKNDFPESPHLFKNAKAVSLLVNCLYVNGYLNDIVPNRMYFDSIANNYGLENGNALYQSYTAIKSGDIHKTPLKRNHIDLISDILENDSRYPKALNTIRFYLEKNKPKKSK